MTFPTLYPGSRLPNVVSGSEPNTVAGLKRATMLPVRRMVECGCDEEEGAAVEEEGADAAAVPPAPLPLA